MAIRDKCPALDNVDISVHCHNDLGLSVANSLAAVRAVATQLECTVNGIGERAGNASLEEIVMALKTRKDIYQAEPYFIWFDSGAFAGELPVLPGLYPDGKLSSGGSVGFKNLSCHVLS